MLSAQLTAVRDANQAFYAAFEKLDLEGMSDVWADEETVSCVHPGWEPLSGRDAVMRSWDGIFRSTDEIRFTLRDVRLFVMNGTGWVVLVEEIESRHRERKVKASAQATNVFILKGELWQLVHHHACPLLSSRREQAEGDESPGAKSKLLH
jgi:ketosteroid isomerase-like protein